MISSSSATLKRKDNAKNIGANSGGEIWFCVNNKQKHTTEHNKNINTPINHRLTIASSVAMKSNCNLKRHDADVQRYRQR
jgi:hypothetical protein